ncbi:MAG: DoxX family protein [Castellaniella sp.]|uniref:DoxX family protein n=1 Tax=Castellaniella sp. TaxID=1955812 RepID=UPI001211FE15|nr:DoxX family protein [Castellaniella sp.]TAN26278.1 MAG: DoxX family protein [Castellaniella sp.]
MERSFKPTVGNTAPYAALLLRLELGIMFLAHGLTKLLVFTPAGTVKFFASVGFPGFLAYPVMAFEIIGGAMLILGVLPRWVAGLAAVELLVASTVHWGNGWAFAAPDGGGWEYPVFLAVTAAALALLGDGVCALKPSLRK